MSFLKVKDLSYTYSKGTPFSHDAITDVNFEVQKGEIIGIIGHTGSGKSTLVQHLNGLIKASPGHIFFHGHDIWEEPKKINEIRFKIGMVFQYPEHQLFDETVYKDISFGPVNMGLSADEIDERIRESAALVGLDENLLQKSPFDLSGGEKRRAAIAGVLVMRPEILILDEPTAGLDPVGREAVFSMIKQYRKTTGAAILIITHSMEDIAKIAEKVLVMNGGRVHAFGTVKDVFSDENGLLEIGLNVPQVTQIISALRARGIDLPEDVFTVSRAAEVLLPLLRGCRYA